MHGTLNSTTLTKVKNEILRNIEDDRKFTKETYPDANMKWVDMVYDRECEAVVKFYYKLLSQI